MYALTFFLDIYLEVELLSHKVSTCLISVGTAQEFSKVLILITVIPTMYECPSCSMSSLFGIIILMCMVIYFGVLISLMITNIEHLLTFFYQFVKVLDTLLIQDFCWLYIVNSRSLWFDFSLSLIMLLNFNNHS